MASDNLYAAAAGALGGVNDILKSIIEKKLNYKYQTDLLGDKNRMEMEQFQARLPLEEESKMRTAQQESDLITGRMKSEYGMKSAYEAENVPVFDKYKNKQVGETARGSLFVDSKPTLASSVAGRTSFKNSSDLRKEFNNRPEVKDYVVVNTNVKSMRSMLNELAGGKRDNLLALDQGLITMFNKLTDPNSVVRESEYARTPSNLPMVNRITGALEKVKQGGAGMTDADREALVVGAEIIMKERGRTFNETRSEYSNLAQEYGYDPKLVTGVYQEFSPNIPPPIPSPNPASSQKKVIKFDASGKRIN